MKKLIIDRFESNFAICEDDNENFFGIDISEIPENAKEGDVLSIDNDGVITIDIAETQKRRDRIASKMNKLKNK